MKPRFINPSRSSGLATLIFVGILGSAGHCLAASGSWTADANGDWSDTANWLGGTVANGADFTASFSPNITGTRTINLDSLRTIGNIVTADGSHDYIISGANTLMLDTTGPAVPTINVTPNGRSLTISSVIDGNDGLRKIGAGQLILNGSAANTFTGGIDIRSGTLNLNFANMGTPTDLVNSGNALGLGGGTLLITGNSGTDTAQTLGNVSLAAGGGQILVNPNGASRTATLSLGTISATASTGTLLIGKASGTAGTAAITTTSGTLTNGIYGGNMVYFNGTANTGYDWATTATASPGPYTVSGFSGYSALPTSGGSAATNYQLATGTGTTTLTAGFSVNTLKMAPSGNTSVLDLGGNTLTVEGGGLLFTGTATGNRITNGTVTAGAGSDYKLFIHSFNSLYTNSGASAGTNNPGITAAINNNGVNPVAVVVESTPGGTAGLLHLSGTNGFTGGLYLNNASVYFNNTAAALNNNTIHANGYSIINSANFSNSSAINLGDGAVLDFRLNTGTFSTSGAVTGKGGITLGQSGGGATNLNFNSTGNNFTGPIEYRVTPNAQNGTLSVNSIADAEVLGSGDIIFGIAGPTGTGVNTHSLSIGSGAIAPIIFNNRRIELAGTNNALPVINNNSGQAFTINTDLVFSGGSSKLLNLGGSGAGVSTFAGDIGDSPNPTTGSTILTAAYAAGATQITLGSVNGITVGAAITGPNIPAATTVTAIDPVTKQVTLSAATTNTGAVGAAVTATGVIGNLSLTKTGASVWTLSGDNSFSGGLTLSGASVGSQLNINSTTAIGTGTFTISGGDNARIDNTSGSAKTLSTNNIQRWVNNFTFVGSNDLNMGTGAVTMAGNRTVTVSASTLSVGGIGESGGARSLTKAGNGTLALNGGSSYTGATVVNAGTLRIGTLGSTDASSAVSVNNSASLVVNGTVNGTLIANSSTTISGAGTIAGPSTVSGFLRPGDSAGVLTFGSTLALENTTSTTMEIAGVSRGAVGGYDGIDVGGALTYDGALNLDLGMLFGAGNYAFNLFDFDSQTGSLDAVSLAGAYSGSLADGGSGVWGLSTETETWTFTQSTGVLNLAVVPEPSVALLCSLAALSMFRRKRTA